MPRNVLGWPAKGTYRDGARTVSALHLQTTQQPQKATSGSPPALPKWGPEEGEDGEAHCSGVQLGRGSGGRWERCSGML